LGGAGKRIGGGSGIGMRSLGWASKGESARPSKSANAEQRIMLFICFSFMNIIKKKQIPNEN
jgi:hypothetical protein